MNLLFLLLSLTFASFSQSMALCNFGSYVLFEILSRAELKTMQKCRTLKECNSLTYESTFMRLHCQRTKTVAGYFLQSLKSSRYYSTFLSIDNPDPGLNLDFLPERPWQPAEILATVDQGLVFCVSPRPENHHYICKPSTRQWEIMPGPNPLYFTRKFGMVVFRSNPLWFKIVGLSDGITEYEDLDPDNESEFSKADFDEYYNYKRFQCEIFDSNSWTWRQLDDLILSCNEYFNNKPAVHASGGLHWLTSNIEQRNILSFYVDKESWEMTSLPDSICKNLYLIYLASYEGNLALICLREGFNLVDIWVISDHNLQVWIRKHAVNLKSFNEEIGHNTVDSFYNADTLFIIGMWTAIFYNFKNGRFNRLDIPPKYYKPETTYFIQTDYEFVQLRPPRKNTVSSILKVFVIFWFVILVLIFYILFV